MNQTLKNLLALWNKWIIFAAFNSFHCKYPWMLLQVSMNYSWNMLGKSLKYHQTFFNQAWSILGSSLMHLYMYFETSLVNPWSFHKLYLTYPWNILESSLKYYIINLSLNLIKAFLEVPIRLYPQSIIETYLNHH